MTRCGLESTGGGKYRQAASHKLLLISNIPNTVGPRRGELIGSSCQIFRRIAAYERRCKEYNYYLSIHRLQNKMGLQTSNTGNLAPTNCIVGRESIANTVYKIPRNTA